MLRAVIAIVMVAGWFQLASMPAERTVGELVAALDSGRVSELTIERPAAIADGSAEGSLRVEWTGAGRPGYAWYRASSVDGDPVVDEGRRILAAAERSAASVEEVAEPIRFGETVWHLPGIAALMALIVLIAGPQPRLATTWAWFWLAMAATPLWLVVVLEPRRPGTAAVVAPRAACAPTAAHRWLGSPARLRRRRDRHIAAAGPPVPVPGMTLRDARRRR